MYRLNLSKHVDFCIFTYIELQFFSTVYAEKVISSWSDIEFNKLCILSLNSLKKKTLDQCYSMKTY